MYLPPTDKLLHFAVGTGCTLLGLLAGGVAHSLGASAGAAWFGIGACALAAVAREAWNLRQGGFFDWRDILATLSGSPLMLAAFWIGGVR